MDLVRNVRSSPHAASDRLVCNSSCIKVSIVSATTVANQVTSDELDRLGFGLKGNTPVNVMTTPDDWLQSLDLMKLVKPNSTDHFNIMRFSMNAAQRSIPFGLPLGGASPSLTMNAPSSASDAGSLAAVPPTSPSADPTAAPSIAGSGSNSKPASSSWQFGHSLAPAAENSTPRKPSSSPIDKDRPFKRQNTSKVIVDHFNVWLSELVDMSLYNLNITDSLHASGDMANLGDAGLGLHFLLLVGQTLRCILGAKAHYNFT